MRGGGSVSSARLHVMSANVAAQEGAREEEGLIRGSCTDGGRRSVSVWGDFGASRWGKRHKEIEENTFYI